MYRRFFRQALPLFISLAVIYGLSVVVKRIGRETPKPFDRLIVEALPEVPDLSGWPSAFVDRLDAAHDRLNADATRRDALVEIARLYQANGFLVQAQSCYLGLEAYETKNAMWPYLLGVVMADNRDKRAVAQHFVDALELDPGLSVAYLRLGHAYREAGFLEEASQAYAYCLQATPDDAWATAYIGQVTTYAGRLDDAVKWLERARELDPEIDFVYDLLYDVYLDLGDVGKARDVRLEGERRVLDSEWHDPQLEFLPAYCYDAGRLVVFARQLRKQGKLEEALTLLERAASIDSANPEIRSELEAILSEVGDSE